jgi:two-component sensor histidine kinase
MARLLRGHAWQESALGTPDMWPERLRGAVEIMLASALPTCIWWGPESLQLYNDPAISLYRLHHPAAFAQPARQTWAHFWNTLGALIEQAISTGHPALNEDLLLIADQRRSFEDGNRFTVSAAPIRGEREGTDGVLITFFETTRRIQAEPRVRASKVRAGRLKTFVDELQHRTRNLISVVGAISARSLAESASLEDFAARFGARLGALGRVTSLLSQLREGEYLAFDVIVRAELAAVGAIDGSGHGPQVTLDGPPGVSLRTTGVQTLALALHELTTNAVEYGGLAAPDGHLSIRWSLDPARTFLHVEWHEQWKAAPASAAAERRGYGRTLIEEALPYQLKAQTRYSINPNGIDCSITLPL